MSNQLRFCVHQQLAQKSFLQMNILFAQEFDLVDWEMIYLKLQEYKRCLSCFNFGLANK
jgi:hypothetical protein